MEEKFDARKKLARAEQQEYAHQYTPKTREENYQYPDEDKRFTNKVKDETNLYGVQPEDSVFAGPTEGRIKAIVDVKKVTEDHRQRSYKIKTQPPIFSRTDIDKTEDINNTHREDEINKLRETSKSFAQQIEKEQSVDISNPIERFSEEIDPSLGEDDCEIVFNVGDQVVDVEENINGKITFANSKRLSVVWEDNTKERFAIKEAKEFLKITKAYVGDVQEQIDPIHTEDWPKNEVLENKIDNTLSSMEQEEEIDQKTANIDLEKIKLQRQVNELENKVNEIDVMKVKTKAANEVITLMQKKGILSNNEAEVKNQFDSIMEMDDVSFEAFKNAIISKKVLDDDMYAFLDEEEDFSDIEDGNEFAKQREEIKKTAKSAPRSLDGIEMGDTSLFENGGLSNFKGNIGDFSGAATSMSSSTKESRSLSAAAEGNKRKPIERKSSSLDMSGFQDIQGLKTPINIPNRELSAGKKFSELFSDGFGWSGVPKR